MSSAYFDNKWHSSSPSETIAGIVRVVLCYIAVAARLFYKVKKGGKRSLAWDDFLIVLALLISTVSPGIVLWGLTKGGSGPLLPIMIKEGNYRGAKQYLLALWVSSDIDYTVLTLIRLSILVFYRSIFDVNSKFRKASFALGITTILWAVACTFANIFMCTPVSHYWDPLGEGKCQNFLLFFLIVVVFEIVMDAVLLVLPIPALLGLKMPLGTRLSIIGIFLLGIFVVITNILRLKYSYQPHSHDIDIKMATIWTYVHITAAFICSCLPFLKPLLIQVASGTRHVSQYARSLLSLGSRHSETIPEDENNLRRKGDDSASGDTSIRMHNYKGRAWIPPNPKEYQHITEARGPSKSDIPSTLSTPGAISVQNEFHVV